ncbi:hypothetical protein C8F01DRAFT_463121 [Mycena amicta]|nr:hypothetical protein C8F01DRAFT_463121 [Mycena amicta]
MLQFEPLDTRNLRLLPFALRRLAHTALDLSQDTRALRALCTTTNLQHHPQQILPVLYVNIRDSPIPDAQQLEWHLANGTVATVVERPIHALRSLFKLQALPKESFHSLWPELWRWISFFDVHQQLLRPYIEDAQAGLWLLYIVHFFERDMKRCAATIDQTPYARTVVARIWKQYLTPDPISNGIPEHRHFPLHCVSLFLSICDRGFPNHLEELVDGLGTGATLDDLAALFVSFIQFFIPDDNKEPTLPQFKPLFELSRPLCFIAWDDSDNVDPEQRFLPLLMRHGFIKAFLWPCTHLPVGLEQADYGTSACYHVLYSTLQACARAESTWMAQMIENNILCIVLRAAMRSDGGKRLFGDEDWMVVLTKSLMYRTVLSVLQPALDAATQLLESTPGYKFSDSFIAQWDIFLELATERLQLLATVTAEDYSELSICANSECCRILPRHEFRACSGCQWPTLYCGTPCQKAHWIAGHRVQCRRGEGRDTLSARDRSFVRAIVRKNCTEGGTTLATYHMMRMVEIIRLILEEEAAKTPTSPIAPARIAELQNSYMPLRLEFNHTGPGDIDVRGGVGLELEESPVEGLGDQVMFVLPGGEALERRIVVPLYFEGGLRMRLLLRDLAWEVVEWEEEDPFSPRAEEIHALVKEIVDECGQVFV